MQVHLLSRVSIAREILAYFGIKAEVNDGLRDTMHNHKRVCAQESWRLWQVNFKVKQYLIQCP